MERANVPAYSTLGESAKQMFYGVGKAIEWHAPHKWNERIIHGINTVLPKLSPELQQSIMKHHKGIETGAKIAGITISTAELYATFFLMSVMKNRWGYMKAFHKDLRQPWFQELKQSFQHNVHGSREAYAAMAGTLWWILGDVHRATKDSTMVHPRSYGPLLRANGPKQAEHIMQSVFEDAFIRKETFEKRLLLSKAAPETELRMRARTAYLDWKKTGYQGLWGVLGSAGISDKKTLGSYARMMGIRGSKLGHIVTIDQQLHVDDRGQPYVSGVDIDLDKVAIRALRQKQLLPHLRTPPNLTQLKPHQEFTETAQIHVKPSVEPRRIRPHHVFENKSYPKQSSISLKPTRTGAQESPVGSAVHRQLSDVLDAAIRQGRFQHIQEAYERDVTGREAQAIIQHILDTPDGDLQMKPWYGRNRQRSADQLTRALASMGGVQGWVRDIRDPLLTSAVLDEHVRQTPEGIARAVGRVTKVRERAVAERVSAKLKTQEGIRQNIRNRSRPDHKATLRRVFQQRLARHNDRIAQKEHDRLFSGVDSWLQPVVERLHAGIGKGDARIIESMSMLQVMPDRTMPEKVEKAKVVERLFRQVLPPDTSNLYPRAIQWILNGKPGWEYILKQ